MKIYNAKTNETYELSEHSLGCSLFRDNLEDIAFGSSPKIAFKCGVISAEFSKIMNILYSLEIQRSHHDKYYLNSSLEILSEIFDIDITEEIFRSLIQDCIDEFLNQDFIYVLNVKSK